MDYTRQAKEVLKIAEKSAKEMAHPYVGTEHLLLGLRKVYTGVAAQVLGMNGVDEENIQKVMSELISPAGEMPGRKKPEYSPRLEYILEDSKTEAEQFRSEEIGTEHMLTALIRDMDCVAAKILTTLGANLQKIYQEIFETVGIDPKMYQEEYGPEEGRKNGVLDQYGTDLTAEAEEGKLDPVIGREEEITDCRRHRAGRNQGKTYLYHGSGKYDRRIKIPRRIRRTYETSDSGGEGGR